MRGLFLLISFVLIGLTALAGYYWSYALWLFALWIPLFLLGLRDMAQGRRAVLRNFPVLGHFRYLFEMIRPEINQYFIESNTDGAPFNRLQRSVVYQRSKLELDTLPFGTQRDVYEPGYEWIAHSITAHEAPHDPPYILIGEKTCAKPYACSLLNISAMSYGSLSKNAVMALSRGAKRGGFAHNTGEGGVSPYHLEGGGDLIWQVGTGYFGCRAADGTFDRDKFIETASHESVRMIELKLSQGAKPGHGGILPGRKVTEEIAKIRGVPMGQDVLSPPGHSAFKTPVGLLEFLADLREASGGKPVGFKLCIGERSEFLAICKAMVETGLAPDFISIDGGEGGTGAAPLEFSNSLGSPLTEGLAFAHDALVGFGLRDRLRLFCSGKIVTGFDMAARMALGADVCYSARGMMMSLGCIQALRCNANDCPVGVATQKPNLVQGLVVSHKEVRVANYQRETIEGLMEILGAAGLAHPAQLTRHHVRRRVSLNEVRTYAEIFGEMEPNCLLGEPVPEALAREWRAANASSFLECVSSVGSSGSRH